MNILLSIKPKYADKIMKGEKKYEFRKSKFDVKKINEVYIYSSSPVKKIIGKMFIDDVIEGHPKEIWKKCYKYSGITKEEYFKYFDKKDKGFALSIADVEIFDEPFDPYIEYEKFTPPQSFYYIEKITKN